MFMYLKKNKKGFTLIELMVVVAIIGILALLGLRVYSGQQEKAKEALVKANAGTIQTLIQAELADKAPSEVVLDGADGIFVKSGIRNPFDNSNQEQNPTSEEAAKAGDVFVGRTGDVFTIIGIGADDKKIPGFDLTARR